MKKIRKKLWIEKEDFRAKTRLSNFRLKASRGSQGSRGRSPLQGNINNRRFWYNLLHQKKMI